MITPRLSITITTVAAAVLAASCLGTARAHRLLSQTANLTLFADAACAEPVYANSFVLGVDTCGNDATTTLPYRGLVVNDRPWCANGSRPVFNLYASAGCDGVVAASLLPGAMYGGEGDGACVEAPGEGFRGMAFLCEGLGEESGDEEGEDDDEVVTVTPTTSSTMMSVGVSSATPTEDGSTTSTGGAGTTDTSSSSSASTTAVSTSGATGSTIRSGPVLFASALIIAVVAI
ncbi:hypothetical protein F4775DRAFT_592990 [Biscogniauxia sp. FL1348]|nr:hypothetical protein F4775DRAFT_592990 [Biscogniauxia sp. FL1348]